MAGFGKSHDRRHRSYERMRRLRGLGVISRSICISHDAAICMTEYSTRDRHMTGWGHFTPAGLLANDIYTVMILASS